MTQPYNYSGRKGVQPISWEDFHGLCKALALAVTRFEPEIIIGVGRAGYYPATLLAHMLQTELYPVRLSRRINDVSTFQQPQWRVEPPALVKDCRVLVVDEISDSGETLKMVRDKVRALGASVVRTAVLYAHSWSADVPDYIGLISDALIMNPWDREIIREGAFCFHPEYAGALQLQGMTPEASMIINATPAVLAKSPAE
jgi:uncharacterized protein